MLFPPDLFMITAGKRKRDDFVPQYHQTGAGYIPPQQDGATIEFFQGSGSSISVNIPQLDGPIPDPYDDALSIPNVDDDEPPLNENDDEEEENQEEDQNTQHLVLTQFDEVNYAKGKWNCTFRDGIMHINNKDIFFKKATGKFEFYKR